MTSTLTSKMFRPAARQTWYRAGGAPRPVAAYQPKGAASLAASFRNLVNPGLYNAAPGVAPDWRAADGWLFNGTTHYLVTGLTPAAGWSALVCLGALGDDQARVVLGVAYNPVGRFGIVLSGAGVQYQYGAASELDGAPAAAGVCAITADGGYRNGLPVADFVRPWQGGAGGELYIGARNPLGFYFLGALQALALWDVTLSAHQVAAVTAAVTAL